MGITKCRGYGTKERRSICGPIPWHVYIEPLIPRFAALAFLPKTPLFRKSLLFALALMALLALQVWWLWQSFKTQELALQQLLNDKCEELVAKMDAAYYCFSLEAQQHVPENAAFWLDVGGLADTSVRLPLEDPVFTDTVFKRLDLSVAADVVMDLHVELNNIDPSIPDAALSPFQRVVRKAYSHSIMLGNRRLLDTFALRKYFQESLKGYTNKADFSARVFTAKEHKALFSHGIDISGNAFSTTRPLYQSVPLVPHLVLELKAVDTQPLLANPAIWIMVMVLAIAFLLMLLTQSFVKTIKGQKRLSEMKNELIANITHEFNTPVTNIALALRKLSPQNDDEQLAIEIIGEENKRISRNIDLVMAPGTLDEQMAEQDADEVDLHHLLDMAVDSVKLMVKERKGIITTSFDAKYHHVLGDESHLLSALLNVLDNAIKYSPNELWIAVRTYNKGPKTYIEIADKGMGMEATQLQQVFERFYRVKHQYRHDVKGFGLGLYFARKVAKMHNGELSAVSTPGKGTSFTFQLPLYKPK